NDAASRHCARRQDWNDWDTDDSHQAVSRREKSGSGRGGYQSKQIKPKLTAPGSGIRPPRLSSFRSGPNRSSGGFQAGRDLSDGGLGRFIQRKERRARYAAPITAQAHDEFYAGNTVFRHDLL